MSGGAEERGEGHRGEASMGVEGKFRAVRRFRHGLSQAWLPKLASPCVFLEPG